jgi:AraC-like DNA-binding protein
VAAPVHESTTGRPAPPLRSFVDQYIGYRQEGFAPGLHRGLPSRHLTFIVSLADPVDIAGMPDAAQRPASYQAFLGGLHAAPATIRHDGTQVGVSIQLTPLGARALLGVPAGALAWSVVDLEDVIGRPAHELVERLAAAPPGAARFAVLDDVLSRRLCEPAGPSPETVQAWERLVASGGSVDVRTLAREVGWSRRHLSERFRTELGLPPKVLARVLRFERARRLLERPERPSLADVAVVCGYYDQAHLNREWRELAGCSPGVWLAEELPSVQDDGLAVGAS